MGLNPVLSLTSCVGLKSVSSAMLSLSFLICKLGKIILTFLTLTSYVKRDGAGYALGTLRSRKNS